MNGETYSREQLEELHYALQSLLAIGPAIYNGNLLYRLPAEIIINHNDALLRIGKISEKYNELLIKEYTECDDVRKIKWINVKDRLPENGQEVLIYYNGFGTDVYYANGWGKDKEISYNTGGQTTSVNITHWQPLPGLPQ